MRTSRILALLFILFSFFSCQREIKWPVTPGGNNETPVNDLEKVTGGVNGIVVDQNNQPVINATVRSGNNTTTTDRYGVFRFSNIQLSKANGTVKVEKTGFFTGYRSFMAVEGRINNVRIKLLPKTNSGSFDATAGGTINISGGGKLLMPGQAVADASGNLYTGQVNVAMTWIDPSSADLPFTVMGDLRGITTTGEERGLSTFGMLGVELTSGTGQALNIATGKRADLVFPIPASLAGVAPDSIDLWHFDEATARWKQEGKAVKTGAGYLATVSHFSFWNCDAPFPLIDLCMRFKDNHGAPLINAQVRIKRIVNGTYGYGRTDSTGSLCGKVPRDENLELQLLDLCGNTFFTQSIGPFAVNTSLPDITVTVPAANELILTGTITNCAGSNVTNGAALVYLEGAHQYSVPVTNGTFTITIPRCGTNTVSFTAIGIDYSALQQSVPVSGTGSNGTVNVGTLQACGTSATAFIEVLVDGTPFSFIAPPDTQYFSDSTNTAGPNPFKAWFGAFRNGGTNTSLNVQFQAQHNQTTGAFPLEQVSLNLGNGVSASQAFAAGAATINYTAFGLTSGTFIEGNFNVMMTFSGTPPGTLRNVVCNFRIRR